MIEIDPETVAALRKWKAEQAAEKRELGELYDDKGLVVCTATGVPSWPEIFSRTFLRLAKAAEVPRIPLKNLRHTHATLLLESGVPPHVVQAR